MRLLPWYCPVCGGLRPNYYSYCNELVCGPCASWAAEIYIDHILGTL